MMVLHRIAWVVVATGLAAIAGQVRADSCQADAEFQHSWPVDDKKDEFKLKFRVSSDDCTKYGCSGYVKYRIHFNWVSGGNSSKRTLIGYRISQGQKSREVVDTTFPSGAAMAVAIKDVEIESVSCSSP